MVNLFKRIMLFALFSTTVAATSIYPSIREFRGTEVFNEIYDCLISGISAGDDGGVAISGIHFRKSLKDHKLGHCMERDLKTARNFITATENKIDIFFAFWDKISATNPYSPSISNFEMFHNSYGSGILDEALRQCMLVAINQHDCDLVIRIDCLKAYIEKVCVEPLCRRTCIPQTYLGTGGFKEQNELKGPCTFFLCY